MNSNPCPFTNAGDRLSKMQKSHQKKDKHFDVGALEAKRFGGDDAAHVSGGCAMQEFLCGSRVRWAQRLQSTFRLFYKPEHFVFSERRLRKVLDVLDTLVQLLDASHRNYRCVKPFLTSHHITRTRTRRDALPLVLLSQAVPGGSTGAREADV